MNYRLKLLKFSEIFELRRLATPENCERFYIIKHSLFIKLKNTLYDAFNKLFLCLTLINKATYSERIWGSNPDPFYM